MSLHDTWRLDVDLADGVLDDLRDVHARLDDVAAGLGRGGPDAWEGPARQRWNRDLARALRLSADAVEDLHHAIMSLADTRDGWLDTRPWR